MTSVVTRDDSWKLTLAITGDPEQATDELFTSHIVGGINVLREERDHLRNQLAAAREHVEIMRDKRAYSRAVVGGHVVDPWLINDISTLARLLAEPE